MAAVLALICALQSDPFDRALELFTRIERDDAEDREVARFLLTQMEPSFAPSLRKMLPFQPDPSVKSAIREAIPVLYGEWARRLYGEGRVDEALVCFAEAAGAPDPAKYVRVKVDDAKGYIQAWIPKPPPGLIYTIGSSPYPGLAKSIRGCFGPWGMAAMLELTRNDIYYPHACWRILEEMGDEAVPVLCREARNLNSARRGSALSLLHGMAFSFKATGTPLWRRAMKEVSEDTSEPEEMRRQAGEMLRILGR